VAIEPTVDLQSPDDIALADKMNSGRKAVLGELHKRIIGQHDVMELVLQTLFVGGNSLIVGVPGLAKTLLIQTLAQVLELKFTRIQFTPDLMPSDITGTDIIQEDATTGRRQMVFAPGPVFSNIVLADEINRTPPKTQSALLEAMQELQVTVEGETFPLADPFHVLATANPIEYEGTYPLPEAQLDRFLMRVSFGYPSSEEEHDVVTRRLARQQEEVDLDRVTDAAGLRAMQAAVETVSVDDDVARYCVELATATRDHKDVLTGSSPRGSLGLALAARGFAVVRGRDYVIPEDVKAVARAVLSHRITVKPELWMTQASGPRVVDSVLSEVATPRALEH
jgi:MoxR-like ATPase